MSHKRNVTVLPILLYVPPETVDGTTVVWNFTHTRYFLFHHQNTWNTIVST